ncbi:MAG: hypothetical protein IH975_08650 [Nitrospinae bacterium]|nr:hypothetical protein [Nitrospinota bacterium]
MPLLASLINRGAARGGGMEEVKDLIRKKWKDIISIPREVRQYWFDDYHQPYQLALNAVAEILDLAEKLKSKRRGKKSKDKIAKKIRQTHDVTIAPGRGRRSLHKRDPTTGRIAIPADPRIVKPEYKNRLRQLRDIHKDVRALKRKGVRTNREIYRELSSKLYYVRELSPAILEKLSEDVKSNTELMNNIRGAYPLGSITFERFEYLMRMTPREAAIEITANYFLIKPNRVVDILGS